MVVKAQLLSFILCSKQRWQIYKWELVKAYFMYPLFQKQIYTRGSPCALGCRYWCLPCSELSVLMFAVFRAIHTDVSRARDFPYWRFPCLELSALMIAGLGNNHAHVCRARTNLSRCLPCSRHSVLMFVVTDVSLARRFPCWRLPCSELPAPKFTLLAAIRADAWCARS